MSYLKAKHLTKQGKRINEKLNQNNCKLIYTGREIHFPSEMDLENYIENYFQEIFTELELVKRQYTVQGQRCDLLCCTKLEKQPVIIELKNEEDRGLVSQLIHYRKLILLEKPFPDKIDYSLPIKLIAIAHISFAELFASEASYGQSKIQPLGLRQFMFTLGLFVDGGGEDNYLLVPKDYKPSKTRDEDINPKILVTNTAVGNHRIWCRPTIPSYLNQAYGCGLDE